MRRFFFAAITSILFLNPLAAQDAPAPPGDPKAESPKSSAPAKSREERLNELFERLAKAKDAPEAGSIADQINRIWRQSGSDTADLLLARADKAMNDKKFDLGLDLLDSILALEPNWTEAWNRRATLHYMRDDYDGAMRDIAQVLRREPRHFGALSGMAMIYAQMGDMKRAVRAGREALKINPQLTEIKEMVDRYKGEAEGNEI